MTSNFIEDCIQRSPSLMLLCFLAINSILFLE